MGVDHREVGIVNFRQGSRITIDVLFLKGVQVARAVFVHHVRLEEDVLPSVLLVQGHGHGLTGDFVENDLIIPRGAGQLPLHRHGDAFRPLGIVVVVVVPDLLHTDDLRQDTDLCVVVPDHGQV